MVRLYGRLLGEPERRLLTSLPALLEKRFAQLRAAAVPEDNAQAPAADAGPRWQTAFQHELQTTLQAELELRWQPIQGLLSALRSA